MLLDEIYNDKRVRESAGAKHPLVYLPFLAAAINEIVSYTAQYRVPVDQLDEKLAESINVGGISIRIQLNLLSVYKLIHPERSYSAEQ